MPDILIRGMEMPDGCHNCGFSYFDKGETNDGEPCTVLMCSAMNQGTNGAEYDGNRPSWCPLVPLPERHGRLIDADELENCARPNMRGVAGYSSDIRDWSVLVSEIRSAQTVVPAEGGGEDG